MTSLWHRYAGGSRRRVASTLEESRASDKVAPAFLVVFQIGIHSPPLYIAVEGAGVHSHTCYIDALSLEHFQVLS